MPRLTLFLASILASSSLQLHAVDVSTSRRTVPEKFIDPPGKRYSIFSGDPERVQRANEVKIDDFKGTISLEPEGLSLSSKPTEGQDAIPDSLTVHFTVTNSGKRSYTLSFPDAQRYDIAITTPDGELVYLWSDDKYFVEEAGSCFVNSGETIAFTEKISLEELLKNKAKPGTYKVQVILANYPEITSTKEIVFRP